MKYRGIVLARLFIKALLVLMCVADSESVSQVLVAVGSYGDLAFLSDLCSIL